jgi:hypothetical protein
MGFTDFLHPRSETDPLALKNSDSADLWSHFLLAPQSPSSIEVNDIYNNVRSPVQQHNVPCEKHMRAIRRRGRSRSSKSPGHGCSLFSSPGGIITGNRLPEEFQSEPASTDCSISDCFATTRLASVR